MQTKYCIEIKKEKKNQDKEIFESSAEKMNDYFFQSQSYFCQLQRTNQRNFRSSLIILMTRRIYENSRIILIRLQALNISVKFSTPKELNDRIEWGKKKKKKCRYNLQSRTIYGVWHWFPFWTIRGIALGGAICLV